MSDVSECILVKKLEDMDYTDIHYVLEGKFEGNWIGLYRFIFTWGVVIGLDHHGYKYRYCYEGLSDARGAIQDILNGIEPTGYTAKK